MNITKFEYLSEHPLSQKWLTQFTNQFDKSLATQLLDNLKLISERTFESEIENTLLELSSRLKETLAVYPITSLEPQEIVDNNPFFGALSKDIITKDKDENDKNIKKSTAGRRLHYGSEHKLGHVLRKLQDQLKKTNDTSPIECVPTIKQLLTQGIKHIVLVDDISGSGKSIVDYWKDIIPKRIKRLLSLKLINLWIVVYTITPKGRKCIQKLLPNFPICNLISVIPETDLIDRLPPEILNMCKRYANYLNIDEESQIGYKNSASPIVFEHGCPNNVPPILWFNNKHWKGLFPNRSIPNDLRIYFDKNNIGRMTELLWLSNQGNLALELLDKLKAKEPLSSREYLMFTFLGLIARQNSLNKIRTYLFLSNKQLEDILFRTNEMGLCNFNGKISKQGLAFLEYFRKQYSDCMNENKVENQPETYYPSQCEGKTRWIGKKTDDQISFTVLTNKN